MFNSWHETLVDAVVQDLFLGKLQLVQRVGGGVATHPLPGVCEVYDCNS